MVPLISHKTKNEWLLSFHIKEKYDKNQNLQQYTVNINAFDKFDTEVDDIKKCRFRDGPFVSAKTVWNLPNTSGTLETPDISNVIQAIVNKTYEDVSHNLHSLIYF